MLLLVPLPHLFVVSSLTLGILTGLRFAKFMRSVGIFQMRRQRSEIFLRGFAGLNVVFWSAERFDASPLVRNVIGCPTLVAFRRALGCRRIGYNLGLDLALWRRRRCRCRWWGRCLILCHMILARKVGSNVPRRVKEV